MKVDFSKLDSAFNPQSLAIIGDRAGGMWLRAAKSFKGNLYSVQVNPETAKAIEATGVRSFAGLREIPGEIDLVIVNAPRAATLQILDDCIYKNVGAVHFFTAGFSETGTDEGAELEKRLVEKANQANLHVIGPNSMGIFNAAFSLGQNPWDYTGYSAPIGFISQSGTHATTFGQQTNMQGMDVNKAVSFGNGRVLDAADFLEYFDYDKSIKVIGMYLEGVRDGKRFLNTLKTVAKRKPVVIWKGGRTEEGNRAIASHTASLAVSAAVWRAAMKQYGAINVESMEELIDTMKALLYLPPVTGGRVGIAGGSGGQSVAIADIFSQSGLHLPQLSQKSYRELETFYSLIGGGYRNPIDTGNANRREIKRIMDILANDNNIDNLVMLSGGRFGATATPEADFTLMTELRASTKKPVATIVSSITPDELKEAKAAIRKFQENGVPAFSSIERAAQALKNVLDYHNRRTAG